MKIPFFYWNYRVMRHITDGIECFAIHEVHYEGVVPVSRTVNSVGATGNDLEDLKGAMELYHQALDRPVLDYETLKELETA